LYNIGKTGDDKYNKLSNKAAVIMIKSVKNRIFMTLFAALSISGFIVICTLGDSNGQRRREEKAAAAEISEPQPAYKVIEQNGRIAVYRRGSDTPLKYIHADVSLMPELDREELRKGIDFADEKELRRYIQDITS
jgi:hypothetical protein